MIPGKRLVHLDEEPTGALSWGSLKFLSEPALTNAQHFSVVHVTLEPGQGHVRHNHPGSEEILYILSGKGEQMVETDLEENGGKPEYFMGKPGDLVHIPASVFHQTINKGTTAMQLLAVFSPRGPDALLPTSPAFRFMSNWN